MLIPGHDRLKMIVVDTAYRDPQAEALHLNDASEPRIMSLEASPMVEQVRISSQHMLKF